MRLFQRTTRTILLTTFIFITLFFAPLSLAATNSGPNLFQELTSQPKTMYDYGKEFCDKRSGDLMNLETWYSGKCTPETDTVSGDGVGFSDIVVLQGIEYLIGPQYDGFADLIVRMLNGLVKMKELISEGKPIPPDLSPDNQGLLPFLAKAASGLVTTKPASSTEYLAYVSSNLKSHHIINEAYAASAPGYGFTALSPILPLWRAFRNISYLLFAFGFVLYGVMIMFRVKIDAKTAASVQLAIPKLVVTLLIITFSYAIVGFMIDISTVISGMIINLLVAGGILDGSYIGLGSFKFSLPHAAAGQVGGAFGSFVVNFVTATLVSPFILFNLVIGGTFGAVLAAIVGALSFTPILGFIGIVFTIIIFLAIALSYIKLIFKLFQAFFSIIVSLIFSPIILLGNLMPGSNTISSWLLSIVGNLAVFPVASFFLVLSYALMCQPLLSVVGVMDTIIGKIVGMPAPGTQGLEILLGVKSLTSNFGNIWTPPMTVPFGNSNGSLMLATIGFGLLMMASKYCEMVEKALKTPPFTYGTAIGESLRGGLKATTAVANRTPGTTFLKTTTGAMNTVADLVK